MRGFASRASKGVNTSELRREMKHRSVMAKKAAELEATKQVRVRVCIHAKSASSLIAVDNRQFAMTSDPYAIACICGLDASGNRVCGASAQTRALKRTLAPKWDEWLLIYSMPIKLKTEPIPAYKAKLTDGDRERVEYVDSVLERCAEANAELLREAKALFVRLDVYDEDALSDDDPLGHVTIPVEEILSQGVVVRKGTYEQTGHWELKYTVGMAKKYKKAMSGSVELKLQLVMPQLPSAFSVNTEDILRRLRPDKIGKSDELIRKYKPFRCPHCKFRSKTSKTLRLHLDLHTRSTSKVIGKQAEERILEEQQRIDEEVHMVSLKNRSGLTGKQTGIGNGNCQGKAVLRSDVVPSTKQSWKRDCQLGRKASMVYALSHGYFHVDIRDPHDQKTPLIVASRWGDVPLVKALLLRKADATLKDYQGNTALAYACQYGYLKIVQMLYGSREGETTLDLKNSMGLTPLIRAAMYNNKDIVIFLLKKGANMHKLDYARRNALDYARLYSCVETEVILSDWDTKLSNIVSGGK